MISLIFELRLILEIHETIVLAKMIMHICSANCTASRLSIAKKIEMSFIQSISNQLNPLETSSIFCLFFGSKPLWVANTSCPHSGFRPLVGGKVI